ncbi:MAG: glycerate kinase [Clostridia bacterium]|nr:glycerate kinase [Clostridia bacterium]
MIWHYFPIGMRFPVADFSEETKRGCWRIALSAAFASDATQAGLYEACETFDPIAQSPVYICIVCYVGIKQSRAAGETLHSLDALLTRLCLHKPLVQANTLESFGPYPILAEIDGEGRIKPTEAGTPFIPTEQPTPMKRSEEKTILIAPPFGKDGCDAERLTRVIGIAATERGFRVRRIAVADGGKGTVRALVAGTGGRYDTVMCEDVNGESVRMTIGVIPGRIAVLESADALGPSALPGEAAPLSERSSACVGTLIKKTLDLGFRKIWIGLGDSTTSDFGFGALHALGMRFLDADGETLVPGPETLPKITEIDRTELDPRLAETELTLLYNDDKPPIGGDGVCEKEMLRVASVLGGDPNAPGSAAAGGLGFALSAIGGTLLPGAQTVCDRIGLKDALMNADFYIGGSGIDPEKLMLAYPNLKGVAACLDGEEPSETRIGEMFDRSILPTLGKGVANSAIV